MAAKLSLRSFIMRAKSCISGAGSAGCGIAEHIIQQMIAEGLSEVEARARIFMVDRFGLLTDDRANLPPFSDNFVTASNDRRKLGCGKRKMTLMDVVVTHILRC